MPEQSIVYILLSVIIGALVGGGSAIIILDRMVKSILNSPVLIRSLEVAAESWPAPVREAAKDAGKLLEEIGDGVPADKKALA